MRGPKYIVRTGKTPVLAADEARNNGVKRQRTEIVANRVQFLGTPPAGAKGASAVDEPAPAADTEVPF